MAENELFENTGKLLGLSFVSVIFIGLGLFFYALFNDYIYYQLNLIVLELQGLGLIGSWVDTLMNNYQDTILFLIPNILDLLWVLVFVLFVISFLRSAYYSKREGYFSALGFLTFGIMIILFILSIFVTLTEWFQNEFIAKLMPTLVYATPFFNLYLDNIGLVNTILIVIAIILNFVDLDFANFNNRKEKENVGNELS